MRLAKTMLVSALAWFAVSSGADDAMSLDVLLERFGWDFETAEVTTEQVGDGLYALFGLGGNVAVSIGTDGVLIVDDQFPEMVPKMRAAIEALGRARGTGGEINYVINTHWHFDHAQGNLALGPAGTRILAHANARHDMARGGLINLVIAKVRQDPYPEEALPSITYTRRMQLHFNGQQIDLIHAGPAHTTGDTAVVFRGENAVHFGDVFVTTGYPFVDVDSGGDIDGMIEFCRTVLDELPEDAVVIPGHGQLADRAAVEAYVGMLETVRSRVAGLIDQGKTRDEVIAARVTAEFDETYGPESASLGFVDRVYTSLTK
ncbi:MAG: MBL fold metallo-hydrolase [Gammaproteobacteria bacterium]|nr:MBL fold metallo-hydrolase [Gammaproteobacteria bacterium]